MIKVSYQDINNPQLERALNKIIQNAHLPVKTAYQIAKISEKIKSELGVARRVYAAILDRHVAKKEDGTFETQDHQYVFIEGHKELYEKEFTEFLSVVFEIPRHKILLSDLGDLVLTPAEAIAISPIVSDLEEVKD